MTYNVSSATLSHYNYYYYYYYQLITPSTKGLKCFKNLIFLPQFYCLFCYLLFQWLLVWMLSWMSGQLVT